MPSVGLSEKSVCVEKRESVTLLAAEIQEMATEAAIRFRDINRHISGENKGSEVKSVEASCLMEQLDVTKSILRQILEESYKLGESLF